MAEVCPRCSSEEIRNCDTADRLLAAVRVAEDQLADCQRRWLAHITAGRLGGGNTQQEER